MRAAENRVIAAARARSPHARPAAGASRSVRALARPGSALRELNLQSATVSAEAIDAVVRAVPLTLALSLVMLGRARPDSLGLACAVASGALASGVGYAIWYSVLPHLKVTTAATSPK